jgi:thiol-disulfide isomerase/thioredoxin
MFPSFFSFILFLEKSKIMIIKSIVLFISLFLILSVNADTSTNKSYNAKSSPFLIKKQTPERSPSILSGLDYEFILFYSPTCPHCIKFEPILKQYANNTRIPVRSFAVDGSNLENYSNSDALPLELIEQFRRYLGKKGNLSVPCLFILNKHNLHAYPVSQGALTYSKLCVRMEELIPKIIQLEKNRDDNE